MTKLDIAITEQDYKILVDSLKNVLGIRPSQTLKFLEVYMQSQYNDLVSAGEDGGDITLQLPTPDKLIKWIKEKK